MAVMGLQARETDDRSHRERNERPEWSGSSGDGFLMAAGCRRSRCYRKSSCSYFKTCWIGRDLLADDLQDQGGGEQLSVGPQRERGEGDDAAGEDLREIRGLWEGMVDVDREVEGKDRVARILGFCLTRRQQIHYGWLVSVPRNVAKVTTGWTGR